MTTNYPSAIDTYSTKIDLVTDVMAADINNPQDAIIAIETELGLNPKGSYADVTTRLADYTSRMANLEVGWIALPNGTRVSDTSFTLPGDYTNVLKNCAKWKGQLNSVQKYGYALSSTYASGFTTVTLAGNNDYNLDSSGTISGMYVSFANPPDFPSCFNFYVTINWTGTTAPSGTPTISQKMWITERTLHLRIYNYNYTSGSAVTGGSFTLPISTASNVVGACFVGAGSNPNLSYASLSGSTCYFFCASVSANRLFLSLDYPI